MCNEITLEDGRRLGGRNSPVGYGNELTFTAMSVARDKPVLISAPPKSEEEKFIESYIVNGKLQNYFELYNQDNNARIDFRSVYICIKYIYSNSIDNKISKERLKEIIIENNIDLSILDLFDKMNYELLKEQLSEEEHISEQKELLRQERVRLEKEKDRQKIINQIEKDLYESISENNNIQYLRLDNTDRKIFEEAKNYLDLQRKSKNKSILEKILDWIYSLFSIGNKPIRINYDKQFFETFKWN